MKIAFILILVSLVLCSCSSLKNDSQRMVASSIDDKANSGGEVDNRPTTQEDLRDIFLNARKATFSDILNLKPARAGDPLSAKLICTDQELLLSKIDRNLYRDLGHSVVSEYYIDSATHELIGVDPLSEKTKIIRITNEGNPIIEFSGFRSKKDKKANKFTSAVFSEQTAFNYSLCEK